MFKASIQCALNTLLVNISQVDFDALKDMLGDQHLVLSTDTNMIVDVQDPGSYPVLAIQASFDTLYQYATKDNQAQQIQFQVPT